MRNKGFTLIELLAVIVILAIIALIAVPIILNIIGQAKGEAIERSKELYLEAVKEAVARKNLTEEFNPTTCTVKSDGNLNCKSGDKTVDLTVESNGTRPTGGTVTLEDGVVKSETLVFGGGTSTTEEYVDESGANKPELVDGLIPVIYDETSKQWKIADPTKDEWYNYDKKQWANAVILSDKGKNKKAGETLTLPTSTTDASNSDVRAMFVWIPRYEYKMPENVTTSNPALIEIKFISKDVSKETDGYILHPGFTFGDETLSGIWVGKFETSAKADSTCYSSASKNNCNNTTQDPYILPNVYSLRYQTVSNQFETAKKFNQNLNNALDSHMMKNSEWGAVAYLSHSKYGKKDEVYINNCKNYITGIGADSVSASLTDTTCTNDTNKYNGTSGVNASTTGNVYGIYDMSGGAREYVMGYLTTATSSGTWGSTSSSNYAGFTTEPENKYFDSYTTTTTTDEEYKGHALGETSGWYGDTASFVFSSYPWFERGGYCDSASRAGVFNFNFDDGNSNSLSSFRVVLAPTPYVE